MINDPYSVLGISSSASNDEIKKAYRELSRKYHPDSYVDNPLAELAEDKFKEVQEAYEQIMKDKEGGGYSYGSAQGSYAGGSSSQDSPEMAAVYNFINSRHYQEALNLLARQSNRNARWYYCSAFANSGLGNNVVAVDHAKQAVNMEPNNTEYRQLLNQLQWSGQRYQGSNPYGGGAQSCGTGNMCCDLWCADSLCECMGGDLCSCL